MLEIQSLFVAYNGLLVLQDINLALRPGEILAVVGPNGAGKTTLIRAVSGVIRPRSGRITLAGQDISNLTPTQRARLMAVVPQARSLPGAYSVHQMVLMGRTPHLSWMGFPGQADHVLVNNVLAQTHTLELADRRVGDLSGGEQQRVLLARALAQDTPILLLDEPTAHLDLQHQAILLNLVVEAVRQQGLAALLALHDLNLVSLYADRVVLLVDGVVRSIGAPSEVLTPKNIEAAYNTPVHIIPHPDYGVPLILPDGRRQRTPPSGKDNFKNVEKT